MKKVALIIAFAVSNIVGLFAQLQFIPAVQSFVNESCTATTWDNLSAVWVDGDLVYWDDIPVYTSDVADVDQSRFTFMYQLRHPDTGEFQNIQTGHYLLPITEYGTGTCQGPQELLIWVLDELTHVWYLNSMIVTANFLCDDQSDCDYGYTVFDVEFIAPSDYLQDYVTDLVPSP